MRYEHRAVSCLQGVPVCYWNLAREPKSVKVVPEMKAWKMNQNNIIKNHIEDARQILIQVGFTQNNIVTKTRNRKRGIARDIIYEAAAWSAF